MKAHTKSLLALIWLIANFTLTNAQIPVESWRDHLPYTQGKVTVETPERVYCATNLALFYYDKTDYTINKLSKINLLSDLEVGYMAYSNKHDKIVLGYTNGNIDIIKGDTKYNFPDIKQKNIIADKTIYHIDIFDDLAYISTGFGIVVFNLAKNEFADTYIIGSGGAYLKINSTASYNNNLYALTDNGIYYGALDDPFLSNYQNWKKDTTLLNPDSKYYSAALFNNKLYAVNRFGTTDSCHVNAFDGQKWDTLLTNIENIKSITADNNGFVVVKQWHVQVYSESFELIRHFSAHDAQQAIFNSKGELWIADSKAGLILFSDNVYNQSFHPNGPTKSNAFEIQHNNGSMLVAPGGYKLGTGSNSYTAADVYRFNDETWTQLLTVETPPTHFSTMRDIVGFAYQTDPNKYIAYSWGYGMVEVENNQIINYYNSATTNGVLSDFVGGATYDAYGNLYVVCRNTLKPFVVKTPDNKWYSYDYNGIFASKQTHKLINTRNNDKWTISMRGDGIFVWNDGATPDYMADDVYKQFDLTDNAGKIISARINDIIQDVEGSIWLATADGVAVYDYPNYVLSDDRDFYARVPQIVVDGYLKGLLEGENVTCIAVDGANRKWLGTEGGGLFLVSGDGTEQIMIYNTDNSRLFSNNIVSVDINQQTGEVFIGTDKGIMTYKSTSTENKKNFSSIYAFPNPVTPTYAGLITIRGLRYETTVKITDISGRLVYETLSNGGDAVWNGKDLSGQNVASGTYLVFCTIPSGEESEVTKILIVK